MSRSSLKSRKKKNGMSKWRIVYIHLKETVKADCLDTFSKVKKKTWPHSLFPSEMIWTECLELYLVTYLFNIKSKDHYTYQCF